MIINLCFFLLWLGPKQINTKPPPHAHQDESARRGGGWREKQPATAELNRGMKTVKYSWKRDRWKKETKSRTQRSSACMCVWVKKQSIILIRGLPAKRPYITHCLLSAASVRARCSFPYTRASIHCPTGIHLHKNRGVRGGWEHIKPSLVVWSCVLYVAVQVCVWSSVSCLKAQQNRRRVRTNLWKRSALYNLFLLKQSERSGFEYCVLISHKCYPTLPSSAL